MRNVRQIVVGLVASVVGLGLLATAADAQQNEPRQAKSARANVATGYEPCLAPDTTTADGIAACSTLVRSDPSCGFALLNGQRTGKGQVQVKIVPGRGWSAKLHLLGLEQACEGEELSFVVSYRTTARTCGGSSCTAVDQSATLASCTVERGTCKLNVPHGVPALNQLDVNAEGGTQLRTFTVTHDGHRAFVPGIVSVIP